MEFYVILVLFFSGMHSAVTTKILSCDIEVDTGSAADLSPIYSEKSSFLFNVVQRPIQPRVQENKRYIKVNNFQHVHMACPGPENKLTTTGSVCSVQKLVTKMWTPNREDKKCSSYPVPVYATRDPVGCPSTIKEVIGYYFWVDRVKENVWIDKLSRCTDGNDTETFYMENTVNGNFLLKEDYDRQKKIKMGKREWTLLSHYHTGKPWWATKEYFMDTYFLSEKASFYGQGLLPRPLAAELDFQMSYFRLATYHQKNLALQWNTIYYGNWLYIENLIRKYAADSEPKKSLNVYTGRLGNIELTPSIPNVHIEKSYSLSEFLIKFVSDPLEESCVVYVLINFPRNQGTSEDTFKHCETTAEEVNSRPDSNDFERGRYFICSYEQIVEKITFLPKHVICKNLLRLDIITDVVGNVKTNAQQ